MKVRGWGGQIQGSREEQQDVWALLPSREDRGWAALVADGMGGLPLGGRASRVAEEAVRGVVQGEDAEEVSPRLLERAVAAAQAAVSALGRREGFPGYVGTTLVLALLDEGGLHWSTVGDSRLYLLRDGELRLLSEDHTVGARLLRAAAAGRLDPEEARRHPERDALVSFLGIEELREVARSGDPLPLRPGDRVLLATDGVTRTLEDREVARALSAHGEDPAAALLEAVARKGKAAQDNATAVVLAVEEGGRET